MPHTPLLDSLRRLARDHRIAARTGRPVEAVRERRATFTRRQVLAAGAAGATLATLPRWAEGAALPRIAIVGGGMAGVTAALTLRDHGIGSTVYEASGRIGGRMFSNTSYWDDGQVSEWCGELIDSGHRTVRELAARFDVPLFDVHKGEAPGSTNTYFFDGAYYTQADADRDFAPVFAKAFADAEAAGYPTTYKVQNAAGRALDQISIRDWIETNVPGGTVSPLGQLLDVAYSNEYGAETTDQSSLAMLYLLAYQPQTDPLVFTEFGFSDERSRIEGGNQRLPVTIARHLGEKSIRLGRRLESIRRRPSGAYELTFDVSGDERVVVADIVIVSIPFAVLGGLDFRRAGFDARKVAAITELGRGRNGKLQMQFRSRLWRNPGPYPSPSTGASLSDIGYQQTWDASRSQPGASGLLNDYTSAGATLALSSTKAFARIDDAGVAADVQRALGQIDQVFPGVAADWNGKATNSIPHKSPFFGLAYSYWKVGQFQTIAGYERVPQGGVLFAGEHTSVDFQGFMEGAASEGRRAGLRVARLLGRV